MTIVLIHGVPDTASVWDPLIAALGTHDAIALSMPGFGAPIPPGFDASKDAYLAWLIGALESLPQPLHVISHDWGYILLNRILVQRPDLVQSWVGGGVPISQPYAWHDTARVWQTPVAGERLMNRMNATVWTAMLAKAGVPVERATLAASHIDPQMTDCILKLYRSAINVFDDWQPSIGEVRASGLLLWGQEDSYAPAEFAARTAQVAGAQAIVLPKCGHWWQAQAPEYSAAAIQQFWSEVGAT